VESATESRSGRRLHDVDVEETTWLRLWRKVIERARDLTITLGLDSESVCIEGFERHPRPIRPIGDGRGELVRAELLHERVDGRGTGHAERRGQHEQLALNQLCDIVLRVRQGNVLSDKGGGETRRLGPGRSES
jgi:hypothetical protein